MTDDIKSIYEFVSICYFTMNQEIQFSTLAQAEVFEKETIIKLSKR